MTLRKAAVTLSSAVAALVLLSCTTAPTVSQPASSPTTDSGNQAGLNDVYAKYGEAGGKVLTLNPRTSAIRIYAFRAGRAAKVGHNHVLSAPQFSGYVYLPEAGPSNARFDLEFRLDQLEIDNPEYRSPLGSAFSSVLSADAIAGTRDHMLGHDNLQADQFPAVRIHSLEIAGEAPKLAVKVQIEMHGQKREYWVPLDVTGLPDHLSVTGSFVMRQTDFGAQPYSVLGGLLSVQDEVVIEFKLSDS